MANPSDPVPENTRSVETGSPIRVFLLAEVRDYTRFSQERGDEEAWRLVARFAGIAREAVAARGGQVIELRGDEALAVFDGARQALRAAVEMQDGFVEEMQRDPSLPLRVGIGLDAGEAIPFEGGYRGRALNLAARLKDQARAGQVLATEALIHLAGQTEGLAYRERGLVHPKGFALPVRVVQVIAEGQGTDEGEPPDEPELRTFLFSDIHLSVAFTAQRGDIVGADLLACYADLVAERVHARGGRVLDMAGDEAFAVFVSPRQAVQAAVELQDHFRWAIQEERGLPLTLGVGLETGEAIPFRGKYTGLVVNHAALICNRAGPGNIMIGETLHRLVRTMDGLSFVDAGQMEVRWHAEPVRLIRVIPDNSNVEGT